MYTFECTWFDCTIRIVKAAKFPSSCLNFSQITISKPLYNLSTTFPPRLPLFRCHLPWSSSCLSVQVSLGGGHCLDMEDFPEVEHSPSHGALHLGGTVFQGGPLLRWNTLLEGKPVLRGGPRPCGETHTQWRMFSRLKNLFRSNTPLRWHSTVRWDVYWSLNTQFGWNTLCSWNTLFRWKPSLRWSTSWKENHPLELEPSCKSSCSSSNCNYRFTCNCHSTATYNVRP